MADKKALWGYLFFLRRLGRRQFESLRARELHEQVAAGFLQHPAVPVPGDESEVCDRRGCEHPGGERTLVLVLVHGVTQSLWGFHAPQDFREHRFLLGLGASCTQRVDDVSPRFVDLLTHPLAQETPHALKRDPAHVFRGARSEPSVADHVVDRRIHDGAPDERSTGTGMHVVQTRSQKCQGIHLGLSQVELLHVEGLHLAWQSPDGEDDLVPHFLDEEELVFCHLSLEDDQATLLAELSDLAAQTRDDRVGPLVLVDLFARARLVDWAEAQHGLGSLRLEFEILDRTTDRIHDGHHLLPGVVRILCDHACYHGIPPSDGFHTGKPERNSTDASVLDSGVRVEVTNEDAQHRFTRAHGSGHLVDHNVLDQGPESIGGAQGPHFARDALGELLRVRQGNLSRDHQVVICHALEFGLSTFVEDAFTLCIRFLFERPSHTLAFATEGDVCDEGNSDDGLTQCVHAPDGALLDEGPALGEGHLLSALHAFVHHVGGQAD